MSTELAITESSPSPPTSRKVIPNRKGITRESMRPREYLTADEVNALSDAAKNSRNPIRDEAIILLGFRHGLRAAEIVSLKWAMVDLKAGILHVRRVKGGTPSTHPLRGPELRVLNQIRGDQEQKGKATEGYVFVSERGGRMTTSNIGKLIGKVGKNAGIPFPIHPHMLRHSCGYYLANDGQDTRAIQHYLGHVNIQHTVRYTEFSPDRFKHFFKD
ncbi:regulator for fimA [Gammaproteobacteria bacterium]